MDSLATDSLRTDTLKKESTLKAPVKYSARDSIRYSVSGKEVFLYGDAEVTYQDINLKADYIRLDQATYQLYAEGVPDSTGKIKGKPVFKEGDKTYKADYIAYNFKTKKGKIREIKTEEGEGYLQGKNVKKNPNDELFIKNGIYSTCNLDHPHFFININKAKVTPKRIITGPAFLVVEDVPLPLAVPFGFFPKKNDRASGVIFPKYGEDRSLGFFLREGGYYFAVNDYVDLAVRGSFYTNTSYGLGSFMNYKKRYKFNGGVDVNYNERKLGEPETPQYLVTKDFFIRWNHNQDEKANPSSRFSANVNAGTSQFLRNTSYNVTNLIQNDLSSSINYSKNWQGTPYNLSVGLTHNQNVQTGAISLGLPSATFNVQSFNVFDSKKRVGKQLWYQKIRTGYTANLQNRISTIDTLLFKTNSLKNFRNGIQHSIPVTTSFTALKYLNISPSFNYTEKWVLSTIEKRFENNKEIIDTLYGFKATREYSTNVSASTTVFGMYPINRAGIVALRHVLKPSVGYSFRPDFSEPQYGYYKTYVYDSLGRTKKYSVVEQSIFGPPGAGKSSALNFGFGNLVELKTKSKKDTITGTKKILLLQAFDIRSSYNMAADSFNLGAITINGRTVVFNRINVDFGANYDAYTYNRTTGIRRNQFELKQNKRLVRFSSGSFALSGNLNPQQKQERKTTTNPADEEFLEYINNNLDDYVDFSVPWSLYVTYRMDFNADARPGVNRYTQSLLFNGDVSVTTKWKIGFNSGYDVQLKKFTPTSLDIIRDLHCWDLTFAWIPFGTRQSYTVNLKVKARVLQDLKLIRRREFYNE